MVDGCFRVHLYFIRHAQSEANHSSAYICGQSIACPITQLGKEQAALLGKRLKYQKMNFDYFLCSTAVRATQTADIVLEIMNIDRSKLIMSDTLLEQSQGSWEGKNRQECYTEDVMQRMQDLNFDFSAPDGESMRMVQNRAVKFLQLYIEQAKKQSIEENRTISIAVFTHANAIRTILQYFLQSSTKDAWLIIHRNTAISEVALDQRGVSLVSMNDAGHLMFPIPE